MYNSKKENKADMLLDEVYTSLKCWGIDEGDIIYYAVVAGWGDALSEYSSQFGWSEDVLFCLQNLNVRMVSQRSENSIDGKSSEEEIESIFNEMNLIIDRINH